MRGSGLERDENHFADGDADFSEGKVFGWAGSALLPVEEELAVAVGEAGGGIDVEIGQGVVDPFGGAFELGPGADGGFRR